MITSHLSYHYQDLRGQYLVFFSLKTVIALTFTLINLTDSVDVNTLYHQLLYPLICGEDLRWDSGIHIYIDLSFQSVMQHRKLAILIILLKFFADLGVMRFVFVCTQPNCRNRSHHVCILRCTHCAIVVYINICK